MANNRLIEQTIKDLEYELAKHKAVAAAFPGAKVHYYAGFQSKLVNQSYTKFEFDRRRWGLWVMPYCEVPFVYDDQEEMIRVHSMPKLNRLVYLSWDFKAKGEIMRFSRMTVNLKNNKFKDDMLNACRTEIMLFVQNNPGHKIDDKHLEPRLKKLLAWT